LPGIVECFHRRKMTLQQQARGPQDVLLIVHHENASRIERVGCHMSEFEQVYGQLSISGHKIGRGTPYAIDF